MISMDYEIGQMSTFKSNSEVRIHYTLSKNELYDGKFYVV